MLVEGKWNGEWHPIQSSDDAGRFIRQTSRFRHWITANGSPGPNGQPAYPAEAGRYQLIVAYICPWACRTLMARALKGLEDVISILVVKPKLTEQGWQLDSGRDSTGAAETQLNVNYIHELYSHADPGYTGRATVPILWDKRNQTIINNESADILHILDEGFDAFAKSTIELRPDRYRYDIDILNKELYDALNNGVYRAGFASSQYAYEEACNDVFAMLDHLEHRLTDGRPFLLGDDFTESDVRAFVTLIRFDAAYVGLFKTNRRRLVDYPLLTAYTKRILALPGVRDTVRMDHIKAGYYSIKDLNPSGIVPLGPDLSELGV